LTIKYLRRESFLSIYPTSLVKDRDHRGSEGTSVTEIPFHPRCGLIHRPPLRFAVSRFRFQERDLEPGT
jgi:hypothetical protein